MLPYAMLSGEVTLIQKQPTQQIPNKKLAFLQAFDGASTLGFASGSTPNTIHDCHCERTQ